MLERHCLRSEPTILQMLLFMLGLAIALAGAGLVTENLGLGLLGFLLVLASAWKVKLWSEMRFLSLGAILFCDGYYYHSAGLLFGLAMTLASVVVFLLLLGAVNCAERPRIPVPVVIALALALFGALEPSAAHARPWRVRTLHPRPVLTVSNRIVSCMKLHACKNLLAATDNDGPQIVFRHKGVRYTFYYGEVRGGDNWLAVWMRPDGTHGQRLIETFSDTSLDDRVDFGITGKGNRDSEEARYFNVEDRSSSGSTAKPEVRGEKHRQYWQDRLKQAYAAAEASIL